MSNSKRQAYIELHIAVFLFGFTAILGKWITISAIALVWWRVFLTIGSFAGYKNSFSQLSKLPKPVLIRFGLIGFIVALHWICFYGSIKLSNASVALICLATTSFMTAILEPIILKNSIKKYELLLGFFILPGMFLIISQIQYSYRMGIWVGLLSALCACIFSVLNKKNIDLAAPIQITLIEMIGAWFMLSLIMPFLMIYQPIESWLPASSDWLPLIVLALLCTTLAYVLSMRSLRYLSAFASNLAINLEPIYGIILAIVLLQEQKELNTSFYIGVFMILFTVGMYPFLNKYFEKAAT